MNVFQANKDIYVKDTPLQIKLTETSILQVFFRAGVLGNLEEIRDDRLSKILSWLQAWIRGFIGRKSYEKLMEQRTALIVVQRNLRKYMRLRNWGWFRMWQKVKPLLNVTRVEDEIRALEEKAAKAQENYEREAKLRQELEAANVALLEEKNNLLVTLESTKGNVSDFLDKQAKLQAQKTDLEAQLKVNSIYVFHTQHMHTYSTYMISNDF